VSGARTQVAYDHAWLETEDPDDRIRVAQAILACTAGTEPSEHGQRVAAYRDGMIPSA
jgi:hypothetical protein